MLQFNGEIFCFKAILKNELRILYIKFFNGLFLEIFHLPLFWLYSCIRNLCAVQRVVNCLDGEKFGSFTWMAKLACTSMISQT